MDHIDAIGFDLFNTLVTAEPQTLDEGVDRLTESLQGKGFDLDAEQFRESHRRAAHGFLRESRETGRETHNSFWISAALRDFGYQIAPDDPRIAQAVDAYFSAFVEYCQLIPGTEALLGTLRQSYPLGLLSNFTHGPAARAIIERLGLASFFQVLLISGELGFRKPHPSVFCTLSEQLDIEPGKILFVGDDPDADVSGAREAGLMPVWTTCVRDQNLPSAESILPKETELPDSTVPRISSWNDLIALLPSA
jgi:putative hydrolase of the HAD superfamily